MRLFALLLLAAPLSAQTEPIIINQQPPVVNNLIPSDSLRLDRIAEAIEGLSAMSDSAMIANLAENNRLLRLRIAQDDECNACGGTFATVTKVATIGLTVAAFLIFWELRNHPRKGRPGNDGDDGTNGQDGRDGVDGSDGADGQDGSDGRDGVDGQDGANGQDGIDGQDGQDGQDHSHDFKKYDGDPVYEKNEEPNVN